MQITLDSCSVLFTFACFCRCRLPEKSVRGACSFQCVVGVSRAD